ncbi:hypothetical protein KDA_54640 [Dictyobacter alpinus]|uniref:Uncharacterized protein n=1 Tax=Dictyobacter alpinus TaxID=2014873 RepID=A0A402BFC8_9CHLR|nr:hypothetical protein [Dictyobacter alpinus]GCE29980.1 hypothetical protein KDA_54640 [Dictyobacter alpinus]
MSSTLGLTPRSALRHRPISSSHSSDIPTWVRSSTALVSRKTRRSRHLPGTTLLMRYGQQFPSASLASLVVGGMTIMLLLLLMGQSVVSWITVVHNDWQYGRPRTFQMDAFVGHEQTHEPSHFIVLNVRGQIEVIEMPGNDASKVRLLLGPRLSGPSADLVPARIRFVPSSQASFPDMRLDVGQTSILFHNQHGIFQAET